MNTGQIESCIQQDRYIQKRCLGCFPRDKLPPGNIPFGLVANTDQSNEEGTHWVALWVGSDGYGEYFDSYGQQPLQTFQNYLDQHAVQGWKEAVKKQIQGFLSSVCGQYCLYYLYNKCRGRSVVEFGDDLPANDAVVTEFVNRKFALDIDTYDVNFVLNQISKQFK